MVSLYNAHSFPLMFMQIFVTDNKLFALFWLYSKSSMVLAGIGLAAVGFAGRYILRRAPQMTTQLAEALKAMPTAESFATSKYYRGGFDGKMTKREASLILGVSPTAQKGKVCSNT